MLRKKPWRDPFLTIAVILSLLRVDWDEFMQLQLQGGLGTQLPEIHDILLGQSAALTETQFHNFYNSYDGNYVNFKNLDYDLRAQSAFRELHTLSTDQDQYPISQGYRDISTWLLDRLEPNNVRSLPFANLASAPNNNNNNDENNNNGEASEGTGAIGPVPNSVDGTVTQTNTDLSPEDMDLIETLWRQDIDMGISRDESYALKEELLLEKGEHPDKLKSQQSTWEHFGYNIDGETGEYVPNPPGMNIVPQQTSPPTLPQVPVQPDGNISLEDCLQLLEDEYLPTATTPVDEQYQPPHHSLSPREQEQRWQDLASIPELTSQLQELPGMPYQGMVDVNITQTQNNTQNAFAINATTNGNVNLQNATVTTPRNIVPIDPQRLNEFPPPPEVFSPLSNFADLSLSSGSPTGLINGTQQSLNLSSFLLPEQQLRLPAPALETPLPIPTETPDNSSLLMELLSSSNVDEVDPMDLDFDEQIHNVMQAFGETNSNASFEGSCSGFEDMSEGSSPYHTSEDGLEGATGYNASLDGHGLNGSSGGYGYHRQRGGSSCGGDSDSGSSFSSYNSQSSKSENVKHNHTYASSSSSSNGNRSSNHSKNSSSRIDKLNMVKLSRDEKRARSLKVPVPIDKIIGLPVDAFNDLLKKYDLNDAQLTLIRDIRRRGKNKVAAQNCRKRKINALVSVEVDIDNLKDEKEKLVEERDQIDKDTSEMQSRYEQLYRDVFENMCDEHGDPVDPNEFTLQQMPDGSMFLVPRNGTTSDKDKKTEK